MTVTDLASLLSLQGRARRNARRSLRAIRRHRALLVEADRALQEAAAAPADARGRAVSDGR